MIVQDRETEWWCISQLDHARVSGAIAALWEPEPLKRKTSVLRAITYHDIGWYDYEAHPEWNPQTGGPYQFRELPFRPEQLSAYRRSIDWMTAVDPYSGLLVSRHRTGLRRSRYGMTPSVAPRERTIQPEEVAFLHEEELNQQKLAHLNGWGWDEINADYRLLQICDLWSMYLCVGAKTPLQITTTEGTRPGLPAVDLHLVPTDTGQITVNPWPFGAHQFVLPIWMKRLSKDSLGSNDAFQEAYFRAIPEIFEATLIPQ